MAKKCVECGDHVPAYLNYLCESCWQKALNAKLLEDKQDQEHIDVKYRKINVEVPESKWF
jgi:NMD protein affecting ribosome stability and mRNA decay